MKLNRLLSVCAASVLTVSAASAYEATAKVTMEGNIVKQDHQKGSDAEYSVFNLDALTSHGKNGVVIDADAGLAGAHFELYYDIEGTAKAEDGWSVNARKTHLWFKPIDQLKVRLGYVGNGDFFVERVDEEKVGSPFAIAARGAAINGVPEYITNADVDEMGLSVAVNPLEGLVVSAAVAPGVGNSAYYKNGTNDGKYAPWGLTAQYTMDSLTFQASFRDNGKNSWKVARAGVGYEDDSTYAFAQFVAGIDYVLSEDEYQTNGFCFDLYGEHTIDNLKLTAHLPLTIRTTGKDTDPNYLEYLVKAEYNLGSQGLLDDVTPYVCIKSFENPILLDDNMSDSFNMSAQPGVAFKVGDCNIDLGVNVMMHSDASASESVTWAVPFSVSVEF